MKIKVNGKEIEFESKELISGKIIGNENEYVFELKRKFGTSLFFKYHLSPFDGKVSNKKIIKAAEALN